MNTNDHLRRIEECDRNGSRGSCCQKPPRFLTNVDQRWELPMAWLSCYHWKIWSRPSFHVIISRCLVDCWPFENETKQSATSRVAIEELQVIAPCSLHSKKRTHHVLRFPSSQWYSRWFYPSVPWKNEFVSICARKMQSIRVPDGFVENKGKGMVAHLRFQRIQEKGPQCSSIVCRAVFW